MKDIELIIRSIIRHQEEQLGPLALDQARTVGGISINHDGKVKISLKKTDKPKDILEDLVKKYEVLFGKTSVEVCKDAVKESGAHYSSSDLPDILK